MKYMYLYLFYLIMVDDIFKLVGLHFKDNYNIFTYVQGTTKNTGNINCGCTRHT